MDLYLVGANGFQLFGFNRSNLFGDPFEVCAFTVKEETNAKLMIVRAAGTGNVRFKYVIFRGEATIMDYQTGTSSIVGHSNAAGAISIGAMLYANIPPFTPVWPGVASFSSRGGTFTLQNNTFVTRNKPELIGPNGGQYNSKSWRYTSLMTAILIQISLAHLLLLRMWLRLEHCLSRDERNSIYKQR